MQPSSANPVTTRCGPHQQMPNTSLPSCNSKCQGPRTVARTRVPTVTVLTRFQSPMALSQLAALATSCCMILMRMRRIPMSLRNSRAYDALVVRINPGQLSQGTSDGTQERFDALMNKYIGAGKLVWSSPKVQTQMGAKDAL